MMGLTMIHPGFARSRKDANMDIVLGIDIGGSTTKIVGLRRDGSVVSMLRVRAEDQVTSLYGALGNYLTSNGLSLGDVRRIVLTGVGASYVDGDIYGLPTCKVDEFSASGTGALALSGQSSAVVVTMGTGTAFLWAEEDGSVRHLCGSGIGGGTLGGLCHKLVGMERFGQIKKLAEQRGFVYTSVSITAAKTRWGSCSSRKTISLSYYLMLLPERLIDYVLLHELVHTREMNHGPAFWRLLDEAVGEDSRQLCAALRNYRAGF